MTEVTRMLLALSDCDRMLADVPGVDVDWLVRTVAKDRAVEAGALALHLLRRTLAREQARAELAALTLGD